MINQENIESVLIAYIENALTNNEKLEVEQWLTQSEQNRQTFNEVKRLWENVLPQTAFEVDENVAWQKVKNKIENNNIKVISINKNQSKFKHLWLAAAAFIGFIVLVTALNNWFSGTINNVPMQTVVAQIDNQKVVLPDGTEVNLRLNAQLQYPEKFLENKRTVKFTGEGFFSVTKNAQATFEIILPNTKVEVLGTQFLVKAKKDNGKELVVVTSGKVKFSSKNNPTNQIELTQNQSAEFDLNTQVLLKSDSKDPNILAWKTKILEFDKASLQEVIAAIENLYQIKITLSEPSIQNCKLSARFDNQQVEDVLNTLAATFSIEITKDGSTYKIKGQGC